MVTAPVPVWEIVRDRQCYGPDADCSRAAGWVGCARGSVCCLSTALRIPHYSESSRSSVDAVSSFAYSTALLLHLGLPIRHTKT